MLFMKALVERIAQDKGTKKFDYDYLKNSYKFGTAYKREDFFLNMYGFIMEGKCENYTNKDGKLASRCFALVP